MSRSEDRRRDYNPGQDRVDAANERRAWQHEVQLRQVDPERAAQPFPKTEAEIRRERGRRE